MKQVLALILMFSLMTGMSTALSGCGSAQAADLMSGVTGKEVEEADLNAYAAAVTDFGVRLFQNSIEREENTLVSPLSVLCALGMTANGAKEETLTQMERVLGLSVEELNACLHTYMARLPQGKRYQLSLANSIWFTENKRFTVAQEFLQRNADYYGAALFQSSFDDSTAEAINRWVEKNTNGKIEEIVDEISGDAVMYLVNALAFEAKWQTAYEKSQLQSGIFTEEKGERDEVEMMFSEEDRYLEDELATGFIKYYADRAYAFAALLPKEGVTVAEYAASLTGAHLNELLSYAETAVVEVGIPQFESEYEVELSEHLKRMGMTDAFDENAADFSGLGSSAAGNLFISGILHKTWISVDEEGTKAGAAADVGIADCAMPDGENVKQVILDRPFVYILLDCENNLPIFIGTVMNVED